MTDLLRIEAVNMRYSISDTDNLSVRRGGGLMLLDAIDEISGDGEFKHLLRPISTGASIGLFEIKSGTDAESLAAKLRKWLRSTGPYRHATFVVDTATAPDFRPTAELVIAKNRWQQMQTLSIPVHGLAAEATQPCAVDRLRPATASEPIRAKKDVPVSASVQERRAYGIEKRQAFYKHRILDDGQWNDARFVDDFQELASDSSKRFGALGNKIAVFYVDGNRFGDRQRNCATSEELERWDRCIKELRKRFFAQFLTKVQSRSDWLTEGNAIRIETLMWGGDELRFVVPAWVGLELVREFYATASDWRYPVGSTSPNDVLTHAAGVAFCHCSAPIHRIEKLTKDLAEKCKESQSGRLKNLIAWVTLESFDHVGSDLDDYLARRYLKKVQWSDIMLAPERLNALVAALPRAKDQLPKSAMIRALRLLVQGRATHPLAVRSYENIRSGEIKDLADEVWGALTGDPFPESPDVAHIPAWVILLELWDYVRSDSVVGEGV